ncbi:MAG: 1-pyrroline-5-carboxylate dehydrogenase [Frankiales bacterium]|nr:1-pyrroline-5-carboxylate dehydrogenase [Frankiales bacterium]
MQSVSTVPVPRNEPAHDYAPGTPQRASLHAELAEMASVAVDLTMTIGGVQRLGGGEPLQVVQPHARHEVLGTMRGATHQDASEAIEAALAAAPAWAAMAYEDRAAILLKAADLLAGPRRDRLNAATMLGQSKTPYQAEIDAACELIDFLRFNVAFGRRLLEEAGLPPGVLNLVTGDGIAVSEVALAHRELAGIHFTGSTRVFQQLWRGVADNLHSYKSYPRLVGETGGKDFVLAHPSADPAVLRTALVRGAFEYQGQKCSAASRAYLPRSLWQQMGDDLIAETESLSMGDVRDFSHFMGAVIDERAFARLTEVQKRAVNDPALEVVAGGSSDDREGWFVRPTIITTTDPMHDVMTTEFFGPLLSVLVYDDADYDTVLRQAADAAPYALTGSVISQDRAAIAVASELLRNAAGNFYVNDKPTGAVVGQQPFGGARASGTNDKAGSYLNLVRWVSPRVIKETFDPPRDYRYPHMR